MDKHDDKTFNGENAQKSVLTHSVILRSVIECACLVHA